MRIAALLAFLSMLVVASFPAHAADAAFTQFVTSLWPEAEARRLMRKRAASSRITNCPT
jgi:hypothetical protein